MVSWGKQDAIPNCPRMETMGSQHEEETWYNHPVAKYVCTCVCACVAHIGEVFVGFLKGGVNGECPPLVDLPVVLPPDVHYQVLVEEHKRSDHKEHPQLTK